MSIILILGQVDSPHPYPKKEKPKVKYGIPSSTVRFTRIWGLRDFEFCPLKGLWILKQFIILWKSKVKVGCQIFLNFKDEIKDFRKVYAYPQWLWSVVRDSCGGQFESGLACDFPHSLDRLVTSREVQTPWSDGSYDDRVGVGEDVEPDWIHSLILNGLK